jgi:hypothetical protein
MLVCPLAAAKWEGFEPEEPTIGAAVSDSQWQSEHQRGVCRGELDLMVDIDQQPSVENTPRRGKTRRIVAGFFLSKSKTLRITVRDYVALSWSIRSSRHTYSGRIPIRQNPT